MNIEHFTTEPSPQPIELSDAAIILGFARVPTLPLQDTLLFSDSKLFFDPRPQSTAYSKTDELGTWSLLSVRVGSILHHSPLDLAAANLGLLPESSVMAEN